MGRYPDDNSNSFQWILKFFFYIYHLGQDLAWDWISASYLIKYAHTGRSCDLLIFGIPEVNFLVRAFQFGMKGVLSRIYDISPGFCWIPIFVFFLNFLRVSKLTHTVSRCPDDNSHSFQWILKIFGRYITWVMILHGIEYQRPTSLNMRILADHVTYSFLAFMKSIFHFCLGCYCGGYSQNGRSNLSSLSLLKLNWLTPGRPACHFKTAVFNLALLIVIFTLSNDNALRWMSWGLTGDKSTLVQVMAW